MPYQHRIENNVVYFEASDRFTFEDLMSCIQKVFQDENYVKDSKHVVDLLKVTNFVTDMDTFPGSPASDIDVAVVRIAAEAAPSSFQLLVQVIKQYVRQQG